MNQKNVISILCLLLAGFVQAGEVKVKLTLQSKSSYVGILTGRSGQTLSFKTTPTAAAVAIPAASVESLEFKFESAEEAEINRLFQAGDYSQLALRLNGFLSDYLPYVEIPSNLDSMLSQWIASSYWAEDYDQVLKLAGEVAKVKSADLADSALFYSMLALLQKGEKQKVEAFLKTDKGQKLFPQDSAPRLYAEARLLQMDKQYIPAIRTAAELVAACGRDADWMPQAELLCAELYFQTGRPESAHAVLDSIEECYTDPLIIKKAAAIAAQNKGDKK